MTCLWKVCWTFVNCHWCLILHNLRRGMCSLPFEKGICDDGHFLIIIRQHRRNKDHDNSWQFTDILRSRQKLRVTQNLRGEGKSTVNHKQTSPVRNLFWAVINIFDLECFGAGDLDIPSDFLLMSLCWLDIYHGSQLVQKFNLCTKTLSAVSQPRRVVLSTHVCFACVASNGGKPGRSGPPNMARIWSWSVPPKNCRKLEKLVQ